MSYRRSSMQKCILKKVKIGLFMSFFEKIELLPEDSILSLPLLYSSDKHEKKANLGIGGYKDEHENPFLLPSVQKAEDQIFSQKLNKEYQPIEGSPDFLKAITLLTFGDHIPEDRIASVQSVGGTSALRLAAEFFVKCGYARIYLSDPTWPNHQQIFQHAGMKVYEYPYYNYEKADVKFDEMCKAIEKIPSKSLILLQTCCHNPTGIDLNKNQWQTLSKIIKKQHLIPFFDLAYQGLGVNLDEDAWPIRYFALQNQEFFVAISYSKNFGLYGERVGALSWYMPTKEIAIRVLSQIKRLIRGMYSNPPLHGGRLITTILKSAELKNEWMHELEQMRLRIANMRKQLVDRLNAKKLDKNFKFMENQRGMFSLSGLSPQQVEKLKNEYGIYMLSNGRISFPGLNLKNIDYVADSIASVLT